LEVGVDEVEQPLKGLPEDRPPNVVDGLEELEEIAQLDLSGDGRRG
jgi:hypothetical protein